MPKIDIDAIPPVSKTGYPAPYADAVAGRFYQRLTQPAGLHDFGVNLVILEPGAWSSQRHWHAEEDEFVIILEGAAVLIHDDGRTPMRAGDCASFPKNDGNGHHLVNESDVPMRFLVVGGNGHHGACHYPDIDLHVVGTERYRHKDGTPWE